MGVTVHSLTVCYLSYTVYYWGRNDDNTWPKDKSGQAYPENKNCDL